MQLVIKANSAQKESLLAKGFPSNVSICWLTKGEAIPDADAYFDLLFEEEGPSFRSIVDKPLFINSVLTTTAHLPSNAVRINAWNGFLVRTKIEIAVSPGEISNANDTLLTQATTILQTLGWSYIVAPDILGMIAARIIAMIVNEAYFALADEVSSKASIDIAMKLGTNYPYGPFEWSEKIGLAKIYALLTELAKTDPRYIPAPNLQIACMNQLRYP